MPHSRSIRVVIPARFGSSRLPGKPLVDLAGKPMVVRVYEAVRSALADVDITVAADDSRIADVLNEYAVPNVSTRPDHDSGTDRIAEVARFKGWSDDDIVINVQGDEPLVPMELLRAFSAFLRERETLSMATIAVPVESYEQLDDPNLVKLVTNAAGEAMLFSRAAIPFNRDLKKADWPLVEYLRHVGIYGYRNAVLQRLTDTPPCSLERSERLEQLRALWLGIPISVMRWHVSPPHGVDTLDDVSRVSAILKGHS